MWWPRCDGHWYTVYCDESFAYDSALPNTFSLSLSVCLLCSCGGSTLSLGVFFSMGGQFTFSTITTGRWLLLEKYGSVQALWLPWAPVYDFLGILLDGCNLSLSLSAYQRPAGCLKALIITSLLGIVGQCVNLFLGPCTAHFFPHQINLKANLGGFLCLIQWLKVCIYPLLSDCTYI